MSEIEEGTLIGSADSDAPALSCHALFEMMAELRDLARKRRRIYQLNAKINQQLKSISRREEFLRRAWEAEARRISGKYFVTTPWKNCAANPPPS